ncbi:MAG: SPOR domain-containing protein [Bacteroidales bacterium]|nr:SPOR domain-containing protein [Bacteroidales bacterium]
MNITNYIVEFLKQGNIVEIKGIGTLSPKTISTRFDDETKTYFPTLQTVEFSTICNGNEQIISYIAKQEFIGVTTAEKLWENYIAALNDKLKVDGKHEFPEVGELILNAETGYTFNVFDGVNFSKATRNLPILDRVMTYELDAERENPFDKFDHPVIPSQQEEASTVEEQPQEQEDVPLEDEKVEKEEPQEQEYVEETIETVNTTESGSETEENRESEEKIVEMDNDNMEDKKEEQEEDGNQSEASDLNKSIEEEIDEKDKHNVNDNKKKKEKKKKKGKKKKIIIPIIILLLLLLLGGAYYYFVVVKDMNIPFINEKNETTEVAEANAESDIQSKEVENAEEIDSEESASDGIIEIEEVDTEESDEVEAKISDEEVGAEAEEIAESDEKVKRLDLFKGENSYTFDYTLVAIEDKDEVIKSTCKVLVASMRPQIKSFLKKQRYSTAVEPMEERMNEYVIKRLKELFDDNFFHPARLMSYDNYITDYCTNNLQRQRISRAKKTIISEIQMNDIMLEFLNELIEAGVVTKDKIVAPAPKPKVVPTADIRLRSKQGFDIISGFFKSRDNAVKEAHRFSRRGADAYVIAKGNLYYVSLGSAPSQTAAEALLRQLKTWNKENMVIKKW